MVFDGDCKFCRLWVNRWQISTRDEVEYIASQDPSVRERFPEIPREDFAASVQLIGTDGAVYSGAEAVFRSLAHVKGEAWLLDWYQHSPTFARVTDRAYRFVAEHRTLFSRLTRLAWGRHLEPPTHRLPRWVFLRSIGIIYLAAFFSLGQQVEGLIGSNGIIPANFTMAAVRQGMAAKTGVERFHRFPTLCWISASDRSLRWQCAAGIGLSLVVIAGVAPAPALFLLWLIYLSLTTVCREFLSFQWDGLLLETGFLAIFFAPWQWLPRGAREQPPSRLVLWLLRLLLFRLMFESGCVKLFSGDPTWRDLTALTVHYETQPLPTWIGWYAHQLPAWIQKGSTVSVFAIELVFPWLIFLPRRPRQVAAAAFLGLQGVIFLTGNYCFFNLLTGALCFSLLDDFTLRRFLPAKLVSKLMAAAGTGTGDGGEPGLRFVSGGLAHRLAIPLALVTLPVALMQMAGMFRARLPWPGPMVAWYEVLEPFRTVNGYGLFAVMTTTRPEIVVEGSTDGVTWCEYGFRYKPGDLARRPEFIEPLQPRLDWQMWFAALGNYQGNPWFVNFCVRLLQGEPSVLPLINHNPFPAAPPRFVRAVVYEYHFTDWATRRKTGNWWRRELKGLYLPAFSLRAPDDQK
jgi:predicted DCC family thiol-disulfide oxidoreductase YuxK